MYCLGIIALELLIGENEIRKLNIHRFFFFKNILINIIFRNCEINFNN